MGEVDHPHQVRKPTMGTIEAGDDAQHPREGQREHREDGGGARDERQHVVRNRRDSPNADRDTSRQARPPTSALSP